VPVSTVPVWTVLCGRLISVWQKCLVAAACIHNQPTSVVCRLQKSGSYATFGE
jgi:hypothetical protein